MSYERWKQDCENGVVWEYTYIFDRKGWRDLTDKSLAEKNFHDPAFDFRRKVTRLFKTNGFTIEAVEVKKVKSDRVVMANGDEYPLNDGEGTSYHETAEAAKRAWIAFRVSQVEKAEKEATYFQKLLAKAVQYRI